MKLSGILSPSTRPAALLAGAENSEDAAVWLIDSEIALIASADFFAPMVDSPHDFGRIAAANAISDIYAMGARPLFALALTAMPDTLSDEAIADILAGGAACCEEAGVIIAGGHSIGTAEPLYGLAVIGQTHPDKLLTNGGAQAGDCLILGKPLGVGLMSSAHRKQTLSDDDYAKMVNNITTLNRAGMALANLADVHAATDITGFGLLGHTLEMSRASKCCANINFAALPIFECAKMLAQGGEATGASRRNWQSYGEHIGGIDLEMWQQTILTDPQTGGGLLIACTPKVSAEVLKIFNENGNMEAAIIGEMSEGENITIRE